MYQFNKHYEDTHPVFGDDLTVFADKVGVIVSLQSNADNSISFEDAFQEIKRLYKLLKKSHKKLGSE